MVWPHTQTKKLSAKKATHTQVPPSPFTTLPAFSLAPKSTRYFGGGLPWVRSVAHSGDCFFHHHVLESLLK